MSPYESTFDMSKSRHSKKISSKEALKGAHTDLLTLSLYNQCVSSKALIRQRVYAREGKKPICQAPLSSVPFAAIKADKAIGIDSIARWRTTRQ
jgi:hypothetical protein